METKLASTIRYTTHHPEARKHARSTLRRNMGAELYANLLLLGLDNMFTIRVMEQTYPVRLIDGSVELPNPTNEYRKMVLASISPEYVVEEEFRIDIGIEISQVVPVIYQAPQWDYSLRKSSMPEWLKGLLRFIWKEND